VTAQIRSKDGIAAGLAQRTMRGKSAPALDCDQHRCSGWPMRSDSACAASSP